MGASERKEGGRGVCRAGPGAAVAVEVAIHIQHYVVLWFIHKGHELVLAN